jgi:CBS domain-containing protein
VSLRRNKAEHLVRQPTRLRTEHHGRATRERSVRVAPLGTRRERVPLRLAAGQPEPQIEQARREAPVHANVGQLGVVQSRPSDGAGIEPESKRTDQVQARPGVGAQADDITRVGRYLGLEQNDVQWHKSLVGRLCGAGTREGDLRMVRVRHLLDRKGKDVWSIDAAAPVLEAIKVMADKHVGALPVTRDGELVGVVSERDYARKIILLGRSSADTLVAQIMSAPVVTVSLDEDVRQCMELMTERRLRHLPVIDDGRMVGVISIGDLVRAVIEDQEQTIEQLERFIAG